MDGYGVQLALVVVLVILNAVFAGSELALISLREGQLRRLERHSAGGRLVVRLARDPNQFLATIQLVITLSGFLASATAAVTLSEPLVPLLGFLGDAAGPVAIVVVTIVLTFLTLVFGELAPKRVAMQRAETWALLMARPLSVIATLSRPVVWALARSTDVAVRLMGGDPARHREEISPEEIRDLVATHRGFTPEQRMIISGAVEITERVLREVLVPRRQVFTLDADTPAERARHLLAGSGHSRAPVLRGRGLDDTVGVANLRDLLTDATARTAADVARPPLLLPDSLPVSDALRRFKSERQQFALVLDEHGAVDGIVTLEDLLEEVVGEIYDETDRDVVSVRREPDGSLLLPGDFPVHDLTDLDIDLEGRPDGDYTTVAGLALTLLGRVPTTAGDRVTAGGWELEIVAVERHAITGLRVRPAAQVAP
ncbi:Magnesium and cobalt efflux protein CorC [[Actinomadura] parvosata subsp. kistnae]|uniref:Hemolysin n=1 Tax=[Actinomadura] parvosata subsp. kistnae TaxID=1909395 RepID=A0A1U9ZV33_9ACTN|nr:hemolysin family protein [Nonomuraea sp. ATCC 55076]AQZ61802.1 hemolysin [Nonomuraea sp. ATCC 55076]SPL87934.1 Magnesium and cobalt efflux protein CorC [Actinomadura parvosata subsp. kistnae]